MSVAVQALWLLWGEDQRANAVDLARQGEALLLGLGGPMLTRSAAALTPSSPAGDVGGWADGYEAAVSQSGRGMPLSVLWSGISGLDIIRDNPIVQWLAGIATTAPAWATVRERLRTAPEPVRAIADWFQSRAVSQTGPVSWWEGLATSSDEMMRLHEALVRAWWWAYAQTLPTVAQAQSALATAQSHTLGLGSPAAVVPSAYGTPVSTPQSGAYRLDLADILIGAVIAWAVLH